MDSSQGVMPNPQMNAKNIDAGAVDKVAKNNQSNTHTNTNSFLTAVVANQAGEIFELEGYAAVGMEDSLLSPLKAANTRKMPYGSELMYLP